MRSKFLILLCGLFISCGAAFAGDLDDPGAPAPDEAALAPVRMADGGWTRASGAVPPVETLPLSVLALRQAEPGPEPFPRLVPNREFEPPLEKGPERAVQGAFVNQLALGSAAAPGLGTIGFQGITAGGIAPPDSDGNVGPNHYVQWVNLKVAVYDKATGALKPGFPVLGKTLFSALGGVCSTHNDGDPIVLYDSLADRWQISQFVVSALEDPTAQSHQCIAVSKTPDPTGSWYLYDFKTVFGAPTDFIDYEKLATWTDAYYMSGRDFCTTGALCTGGIYGVIYGFERAKMLQGQPARMVAYANTTLVGSAPLISDIDGLTPPPAGRQAHVFWAKNSTTIGVTRFATTWADTPTITATAAGDVTVPSYATVSCSVNSGGSARCCIPQPSPAADPADQIDAISSRLMFRAAYRNVGGTESVLLSHSVAGTTPVKSAFRWYEIQLQTGTPALYQSGTYAPDFTNRWMGSLAMDASGNIVAGYSRSARAATGPPVVPDVLPEIDVAGRLASDTLGTLSGDLVLKAGVGVQTGTGNRWGDYSTMNVDPRDGCTFWYQNQFLPANGSFNWRTWIGTATYAPANCAPEAFGKLSGAVTYAESGNPVVGAVVAADVYSAASGTTGAYEVAAKPGSYSAAVLTKLGCAVVSPASAGVTITNGATSTQDFTVDGVDVLAIGTPVLNDTQGNGNGVINRNECFRLTLPLTNNGCHTASAVSVTVSTATAGVSVKTGSSPYANVAPATSQSDTIPFEFATSPTFVCGTPIVFDVGINSASGFSSTSFTLPTCSGGSSQAFAGPIATTDPTQSPRQANSVRIPSDCSGKTCPGTAGSGPYYYKVHTFTNTSGVAHCYTVNVAVSSTCQGNVFFAAYSPIFAGNGSCTNYLGDIGANPTSSGSFKFTVPGGQQFQIVATDTAVSGTCSNYSGSVVGFINDASGGRPTAAASGSATVCPGQSTPLTGSGATNCSWTPSTGLSDPNSCNPIATPAVTTTYTLSVSTTGGCVSGNTSDVTVTVAPDTTPPVVTPPSSLVLNQTLCCGTFGGATGATSTALTTFLSGGSATDACDPAPTRLTPQKANADVTATTCFGAGVSPVDFQYRDAAGNVGHAAANVTVKMFADLNEDFVVDPSDMVILRGYFNFVLTPGVAPFSAPLAMADLNHDTTVDPSDLVVMRAFFNFVVSCLAP